MQDRPHKDHRVTNEHLLSVRMCTALNMAITERTGGGKGEWKQGIRFGGGSPGVRKKGSPCWSRQSRLSAERNHKQGWELKPGTTMAMGCNH